MPCDHKGPHEVIEMAESWLQAENIEPSAWSGRTFRFGENLDGGMWASVVTEIERRGGEWIVTRLDRNPTPIPEGEVGFRAL